VNGMRRLNVIIYQNETKFEIYCNDKTESHHITENKIESGDEHHNLGMEKVTHYTYCDLPGSLSFYGRTCNSNKTDI
jgi:hypothetical protein